MSNSSGYGRGALGTGRGTDPIVVTLFGSPDIDNALSIQDGREPIDVQADGIADEVGDVTAANERLASNVPDCSLPPNRLVETGFSISPGSRWRWQPPRDRTISENVLEGQ
ncbi:MAG: hypothetical protein V5A45_05235 [Haloarculaceae archaeon]